MEFGIFHEFPCLTGRSGVAATYEAYGVPYGESRDRFAEALDIVQLAWTRDSLSYQGRFHRFENVRVTPRPFQLPMPPIRVTATSPDSFGMIPHAQVKSALRLLCQKVMPRFH
jgi:alkanesulfonate monooxygenase SsuD/methylene tetrahydromethanopterin reductase-like flavin-dependent oxidoreductase (luciferase family)